MEDFAFGESLDRYNIQKDTSVSSILYDILYCVHLSCSTNQCQAQPVAARSKLDRSSNPANDMRAFVWWGSQEIWLPGTLTKSRGRQIMRQDGLVQVIVRYDIDGKSEKLLAGFHRSGELQHLETPAGEKVPTKAIGTLATDEISPGETVFPASTNIGSATDAAIAIAGSKLAAWTDPGALRSALSISKRRGRPRRSALGHISTPVSRHLVVWYGIMESSVDIALATAIEV